MLVVRSVDEFKAITPADARYAITIGNFDGVHMGHRELIRVTKAKAETASAALGREVRSLLVTFDPHPVHMVRGVDKPYILTPLPRKLEILEQTGLDAVLVLPFTMEMARTDADEFVKTYIADLLRPTDLVVGYNFAMGKDRGGNYTTLCRLGGLYGFDVTQVQPVIVERETVSSSLIREHIRSGDMDRAAKLMGRMYSVDGKIIHGRARGRKIGFPTANIDYGNVLLPPLGAYATWLRILPESGTGDTGGKKAEPLQSMTSVGTNPTFGGGAVTLETHALDFCGDLYGKMVRLHFVCRLRAEITFQSVEDLIARLGHDADCARESLRRNKKEVLI